MDGNQGGQQDPFHSYARAGNYVVLKTIGTGYNSKVKLVIDPTTHARYAMKIIRRDHPQLSLKGLRKEIGNLQHLNEHPNITKLIGYDEDLMYYRRNGNSYKVVAIVMEIIPNGEIFDYIKVAVGFPESVARMYFRILIETLDYCHKQGIVHRDLKAQNLLFDADFNLKVADFGFATLAAGKEGDGLLKTICGTPTYEAPELIRKDPTYNGVKVDIFASGVILFQMRNGWCPYNEVASLTDSLYGDFHNKNTKYWARHTAWIPKGQNGQPKYTFSDEFKDLINKMLCYNSDDRISIEDIKAHPWYTSHEVTNLDGVRQALTKIKEKIDLQVAKERQKKLEEKQKMIELAKMKAAQQQQQQNPADSKKDAYAWMFQQHKPFRNQSDQVVEQTKKLVKSEQERILRSNKDSYSSGLLSQLYTSFPINTAFEQLVASSLEKVQNLKISKGSYKIKGIFNSDSGRANFSAEITKVDDEILCIEFDLQDGKREALIEFVENLQEQEEAFQVTSSPQEIEL